MAGYEPPAGGPVLPEFNSPVVLTQGDTGAVTLGPRVDTHHPDYDFKALIWERIRDCMAGPDQIRYRGSRYLPVLEGQPPNEYAGYKLRAKFVNLTKSTVEMLHGFIFRKDPIITLNSDLEEIRDDVTSDGKSLLDYTRDVVDEVIQLGRGGTVIDLNTDLVPNRPYFAYYRAEQIINWKTVRKDQFGKAELGLLVLEEIIQDTVESLTAAGEDVFTHNPLKQWRIYRLETGTMTGAGEAQPRVICEIYRKDNKNQFNKISSLELNRQGTPLDSIPFVFHGSDGMGISPSEPPMAAISDLNISHYRTSADLENGRHFAGCPQAWAKCWGLKRNETITLGSSTFLTTENKDASIGYLEFGATGLGTLEKGSTETEKQIAALGARMLEEQRADEAYQTVLMRQSGQTASLTGISNSCSQSITMALLWAGWWLSTEAEPKDLSEDISIALNTDFIETTLVRGQLTELMQAWQMQVISRDTLHSALQRSELIPADRDLEEEMALIEANPPPAAIPPAVGAPGGPAPGQVTAMPPSSVAASAAKAAA